MLVLSGDFDVDWRRGAEVEDLRHDVRRLEEKLHTREPMRERFPQPSDVLAGWVAALLFELDEDLGITGSDCSCIAVTQVYAAVGQADIVQERDELFFRDCFANRAVHFIRQSSGFFDAQAGARAHVQPDLAGVHLWEKISSENQGDSSRCAAEGKETRGEELRPAQRGFESPAVSFAESLEVALEHLLVSTEETLLLSGVLLGAVFVLGAEEIHRQGRHDRPGPHVGRQHGEHDSFGQGHKQKLGHSGQEKHGHEHNADAERGDKGGDGDLLRAVENRLDGLFSHGEIAVDVFDLDRGVVHEDTDGQRQPAQGHDVDRLAQRAKADHTDQDGQGNGNGNDKRALPVPQKEQNHDGGEAGGDQRFAKDALDGGADKERLVEEQSQVQVRREGRGVIAQHLLDARDDVEGGGAAGLVHAHEYAALAVGPNDIRLWGKTVANVRDFFHVDRGAIRGFDGEVVQLLNALRTAVHLDRIFESAELRRAGGQNQILLVDGVNDVHGRETLCLQRLGVEVHRNQPLLAAVWIWERRALDCGELRADKIIAVVKKLLLAEPVARQTDLDHGHGGCREDGHERRIRSRRKVAEERLRDGHDLRERRLDVGALLKEDLDDGNTGQGLRFNVLDIVDQRGDTAFGVGGDALLHLLRLEPLISPHDADDGNVDFRKNVGGRSQEHDGCHQNDDEGHYDKRVWPRQC